MARPMILIKQPLLEQMLLAYTEGVPISKLIRKHHLPITQPTLTKLLSHLSLAKDSKVDPATKAAVEASLFPEWLGEETGSVVTQSPNWHYTGRMPLGSWFYRELTDGQ